MFNFVLLKEIDDLSDFEARRQHVEDHCDLKNKAKDSQLNNIQFLFLFLPNDACSSHT